MAQPTDLLAFSDDVEVPAGLPLVAGLTGFADAGGAVAQFTQHLLTSLRTTEVARFDSDELLDYRARRPIARFEQDHLTSYDIPVVRLLLAQDDVGRPFLLLTGFEPDYRWQAFVEALQHLVRRFSVSTVTWVHAIPMPVPHTRPIQVTVSGNRGELVEQLSAWRPTTEVPANVLHLLEHRLYGEGDPVAGFVLLVPHYLAETELPAAAVTSLESISAATGLIFPTDALREAAREFLVKIDEQVAGNAELARLVSTLEQRHDTYMAGNPLPSPLMDEAGDVPSADTIAAELEKFLARRATDAEPES